MLAVLAHLIVGFFLALTESNHVVYLVMARTPEGKVKDAVTKILRENGAYYFFPATGGYGRSGVPDIVACFRGKFFGIECKAGKGDTTTLQDRELDKIRKAGGVALVIHEHTVHIIAGYLKLLGEK